MLRLIIVTQIILRRDVCPFPWPSFFSMFSDGCLKNVNTNAKVDMSQYESGLLSFRKTLPKQANISARSHSLEFVGFFKWMAATDQFSTEMIQRWCSGGDDQTTLMMQKMCGEGYGNYIDLSCKAHWDENGCVTIQGNMISFPALYECSPNTGIRSAPSAIANWGCFGWHRLKWGWKEKNERIILLTDM